MKKRISKIISGFMITSFVVFPIVLTACNNETNNNDDKNQATLKDGNKAELSENKQHESTKMDNQIFFTTKQDFSFGFKDKEFRTNQKPSPIFLTKDPKLNQQEQEILIDLYFSWYNYYQKTFANALYLYYIYDYALFNLYGMDYSNVVSEFIIHYDATNKKFNLDYEIKLKVDGINNINAITPTTFYKPINEYQLDSKDDEQKLISADYGKINLNWIKNNNKQNELKVYFITPDNITAYAENKIKMRIAYRDLDVAQVNVKYSNSTEVYKGYAGFNGKLYRWFNKSVTKKNVNENILFMLFDNEQLNVDSDFEMIKLNQDDLKEIFLIKKYPIKEADKTQLTYSNIFSLQLDEFNFDLQNYFLNVFVSNQHQIIQPNNLQNNRKKLKLALEIIKQKVLATKQIGLVQNRYAIYSMFNYFDLTLEPDKKPSDSKHCHADGFCH